MATKGFGGVTQGGVGTMMKALEYAFREI